MSALKIYVVRGRTVRLDATREEVAAFADALMQVREGK